MTIEVFLVIDAVFDNLALVILLALGRAPTLQVAVDIDPNDFIRSKEAVFDTLFQGVAVDRLAEVIGAGDLFSLFGRGREADLGGGRKVIQNLTPG